MSQWDLFLGLCKSHAQFCEATLYPYFLVIFIELNFAPLHDRASDDSGSHVEMFYSCHFISIAKCSSVTIIHILYKILTAFSFQILICGLERVRFNALLMFGLFDLFASNSLKYSQKNKPNYFLFNTED